MALTDYVPGTTGWYQRRYKKYLAKLGGKASAVCFLEYPDQQVIPWPAEYDEDLQGWVLPNGLTIYPRGKGGSPKQMAGVDVVYAYIPNAGVISTELSLIGRALEYNEFTPVDERGRPIDTEAIDRPAPGVPTPARAGNGSEGAVADGGVTAAERLGSPDAQQVLEETGAADAVTDFPLYHAVEYELSDADEYDPAPVDANDARLAAEKKKQAAREEAELMKWAGIGLAAGVVVALVLLGFVWLLNQIGGGGGGGSGGGWVFGQMLRPTAILLGGMVA